MEPGQYLQPQGESSEKKSARLYLLLLTLLVAVSTWFWLPSLMGMFLFPAETIEVSSQEKPDVSLQKNSPLGIIIYTTPVVSSKDETNPPRSYAFNLVTNTIEPLVDEQPSRDTQIFQDSQVITVAPVDDKPANRAWQPHQYDATTKNLKLLSNVDGYFVNDIKFTPGTQHFAYSYRAEENPKTNSSHLNDWKIAIHSLASTDSIIIDSAAEPEWINGGTALLYTSPEGIFRYDIASGQTTNVWSDFSPFAYGDDMAVSPDGTRVAVTIPNILGMRMLAVLEFEGGNTTAGQLRLLAMKTEEIKAGDTVFTHPVFSPDGKYLAVAAGKQDVNVEPDTIPLYKDVIEVSPVTDLESVHTIILPNAAHTEISLEGWVSAMSQ